MLVAGNDLSPLPDTEVHYLRSANVGDEFKIVVGHCGASEGARQVPVFLGDTWANFGTAVEIIRLRRFSEVVPPILVVGVGYRTVDLNEIGALRCRDFTPTVDLASGYSNPDMMGGADRFLAFLRDELRPWVNERFDVDPDDSMFFGDSLGGLFATHVLLTEPTVFRRYGIGSPDFDWDKKLMFNREAAYAEAHDDLAAKVFFSVGSYENSEDAKRFRSRLAAETRAEVEAKLSGLPAWDLTADTERMVAALRSRAYPSLEIELEVLPDEYHDTAPPLNLSRSVRYLFDMPR